MYVLDTDVLSSLGSARANPRLRAWFDAEDPGSAVTTVISIMEIESGIALLEAAQPLKASQLQTWLDGVIETAAILPLDIESARLLGRLRVVPALRHFIVTSPAARQTKLGADLAIAVIARQHDATVATGNFADFRLIANHCPGLRAFDPFTGRTHAS